MGEDDAYDFLPTPLTSKTIPAMLAELAPGTKRAVETCLECWKVRFSWCFSVSVPWFLVFFISVTHVVPSLATIFVAKRVLLTPTASDPPCDSCPLQDKRLSNDDLLSFLRSISSQSSTLSLLFSKDTDMSVVASASEMDELRALAGITFGADMPVSTKRPAPVPTRQSAPSIITTRASQAMPAARPHQNNKRGLEQMLATPASPKRTRAAPNVAMPAVMLTAKEEPIEHVEAAHSVAASSKHAPVKRTRRPKITEPTDEESRLMQEWSQRRVGEIFRRQNESSGVHAGCPEARKKAAFMRFVMTQLRRSLPVQQLPLLLDQVKRYNAGSTSADDFSKFVWDLVERNNIVVPLTHQAEVNIRPRAHSWLAASRNSSSNKNSKTFVSMDLDEDEDEACGAEVDSAKRQSKAGSAKGESSSDDDAQCPVCSSTPLEDER
jgi:hypothetical protein